MKRQAEIVNLGNEIRSRVDLLPPPNTEAVRAVRTEFSRRLAKCAPELMINLAFELIRANSNDLRFVAYELVAHHKPTFSHITEADLLKLGTGIDSWSSVDCFAMILSGPLWAQGRLRDETLIAWTSSPDRWWRRAALVTTVLAARHGDESAGRRVLKVCTLLAADKDDMVVKALSWAIRELSKNHPDQARAFLATHKSTLSPRVIREVNNKLRTGLKTPRRPK